MKKWLIFLALSSFSFRVDHATGKEPLNEPSTIQLSPPVKHRLLLSGCFGELRNNHFHGGLDIRSSHSGTPDEILAAAGGYISKIEINSDSYGKTLFINHPGGFTTVYAHILRFRPDIEDWIKVNQYEQKSYEVKLLFGKDDLPVQAGDFVAYMGNTGASRGTHLHFELRKTITDEILDPLEFGLNISDHIAPVLKRIKFYGFAETGERITEKILLSKNIIAPVSVSGDYLGLGIDAVDRNDQSWTTNGLKEIKLFLDTHLIYHYRLDGWQFSDSRYMNAHIDYLSKTKSLGHFHRCFKLPGNCLPIYKIHKDDGLVSLSDSAVHHIHLEISDAHGNNSRKSLQVIKGPQVSNTTFPKCEGLPVMYDEAFEWKGSFGRLTIDAGTLYESTVLKFDSLQNNYKNGLSKWFGVSAFGIPVHKNFKIALIPQHHLPDSIRAKCRIAVKSGNIYRHTVGSYWTGDTLCGEWNSLGYFAVVMDTIAPKITPVVFKYNMNPYSSMKFRIADNIPSVKVSKELKYEAYLDGNWILMEHDAKTRTIRYEFDKNLSPGKHVVQIIAVDEVNNRREFKSEFIKG